MANEVKPELSGKVHMETLLGVWLTHLGVTDDSRFLYKDGGETGIPDYMPDDLDGMTQALCRVLADKLHIAVGLAPEQEQPLFTVGAETLDGAPDDLTVKIAGEPLYRFNLNALCRQMDDLVEGKQYAPVIAASLLFSQEVTDGCACLLEKLWENRLEHVDHPFFLNMFGSAYSDEYRAGNAEAEQQQFKEITNALANCYDPIAFENEDFDPATEPATFSHIIPVVDNWDTVMEALAFSRLRYAGSLSATRKIADSYIGIHGEPAANADYETVLEKIDEMKWRADVENLTWQDGEWQDGEIQSVNVFCDNRQALFEAEAPGDFPAGFYENHVHPFMRWLEEDGVLLSNKPAATLRF